MGKYNIHDYVGKTFNKITILSESLERNKRGERLIIGLCECGKTKNYLIYKIISGHTKSCGCLHKKHGHSRHPLHIVWSSLKIRCYDPDANNYKNYGGRGVTICDEWRKNFKAFFDWCISNGWQKGLELDKDVKGNGLLYSPQTCCFLNKKENLNHRRKSIRFIHDNKNLSISEWAEILNINIGTLDKRYRSGWPIEKILEKPKNKYKKTAQYADDKHNQ